MNSTLHIGGFLSGRGDRQGAKGPWLGGLSPKQKAEGKVDVVHYRWVCGEDLKHEGLWVSF